MTSNKAGEYINMVSSLLEGSRKITGNITAINTGGHTEGHMVIFFEINSKKYMYLILITKLIRSGIIFL